MIAAAGELLIPSAVVLWGLGGGDANRSGVGLILRIGWAMVLAPGLTSSMWFVWLELLGTPRWGYVTVETAVLVAVAVCLRRAGTGAVVPPPRPIPAVRSDIAGIPVTRLTAAVLLLLTATWAVSFLATVALHPHGSWDAVAIWNLHARFLAAGSERWDEFIHAGSRCAFHGDYPLLVPVTVARLWTLSGTTAPGVGALVSFWFAAATLLVCTGLVASVRSALQAALTAATLLGTNGFIAYSSVQYADLPLAACMLAATSALVCTAWTPRESPRWLAVAGAATAFAAWTKNEGLLFLVVALAVRAAAGLRPGATARAILDRNRPYVLGLLPGLLAVAGFKLALAPGNDLVAGQGLSATLGRIVSPGRYVTIIVQLIGNAVRLARALFFILPAYFALMGRSGDGGARRAARTVAVVYGLMLLGYFAVYVTTPQPLYWHLNTSARRLLLQLWPGFVCAFFLLVAAPEERLA